MRSIHVVAAVALICTAAGCSSDPDDSIAPTTTLPVTVPLPGDSIPSATSSTSTSTTTPDDSASPPIERPVQVVGEEDCPDSRFHCVTLEVPRDHFSDDPARWQITFAIQRAEVKSTGTFVTITGGPGSAGIFSADSYTDAMSTDITDDYDIVFLNQRGSSGPQEIRCDDAAAAYYSGDDDTADPAQRDAVAEHTQTFVDDCVAESGVKKADLPYYSTRQAAEDLDVVRRYLEVDQLSLYGESYGTQFVQTYAASHPDHVAALIIDGVVDLTTDSLHWYAEATRAYSDALFATLAGCDADEACSADAGPPGDDTPVQEGYDALAEQLDAGPIEYDFPLPDGTTSKRFFTSAALETVASGYTGSLGQRMRLQRATAAAIDGNLVPLARLYYEYLAIDSDTLQPTPDPSWSDALYYAVECQDYSFEPGETTARDRMDAWLDEMTEAGVDDLRLPGIAATDLPCLFWPAQPGEVARPAPITDPPYPTFVLTADTDPATPTANAMRVFGRLDDAYLVMLQNGPHVIFGWGYSCVDDLISSFLGSAEEPATKVTVCDGDIADEYVANAPEESGEYVDRADAEAIIADQVLNEAEYWAWDGGDELTVGCDFGGTLRYSPADDGGVDLEFTACQFTDKFPLSGDGTIGGDGAVVLTDVRMPTIR